MKINITNISLCVILGLAVALGGCSKKGDEAKDGESTGTNLSDVVKEGAEAGGKMIETAKEKAVEVKEKAAEKILSAIEQCEADQGKTIEEITADAKEMAAEKVRKVAEIYRDAIAESQQSLRELTDNFIALPDADKNGPQGQIIKALIDSAQVSVTSMKERFGVYLEQLKELSGDVSGLE